jgi:hypothetical protein
MTYNDLTGKTFNRLTVLSHAGPGKRAGQHLWLCRCSCGNQKEVLGNSLRSGNTQSCGCLVKDRSTRRRQPAGELHQGRATRGERRAKAPRFEELVEMHNLLLECQRECDRCQRHQKIREMDIVSPERLISKKSQTDVERRFDLLRTRFELSLGFFVQSDRCDELTDASMVDVVLMCVDFPPFNAAVLRRLLDGVVRRSEG